MKMRKKLAALLAAAMIASVMPMTAFAASTNRITTEVKTVGKNSPVTGTDLVIKLQDKLEVAGGEFYLTLENAEWDSSYTTTGVTLATNGWATREDAKTLKVVATGSAIAVGELVIPLKVDVKEGEVSVTVDGNETVVSSGKYIFAVTDTSKAEVKVADPKVFVEQADAATITIEEPYKGVINPATTQTITIELDDSDFEFVLDADTKVVGKRGLTVQPGQFTTPSANKQTAVFVITSGSGLVATGKGMLEITGLKIKANRKAAKGDVTAYISGTSFDPKTVVLGTYGEFSVNLATKKVEEFTAGSKKTVKFTLEEVGNTLVSGREGVFTLTKGVKISSLKINAGSSVTAGALDLNKDLNEVIIPNLANNLTAKNEIAFEVELIIPAKFEGDVAVEFEARGLDGAEVKLAEVKAPVTLAVEPMKINVGQKDNTGGKITITETDKKMIDRKELIIQLPADLVADGVEFMNVKDLVIETTGGIKTGKAELVTSASAIVIPVTRQSTEAGSITVSGFEVKSRRLIADGAYEVSVGGPAISSIATLAIDTAKHVYANPDAIAAADFLLVGDKLTKAEVVFNIGSSKYLVDGVEMTMDAEAYIKDGRTMVPLRYLAVALGIDTESIKFHSGTVTIFDANSRVIQVSVGSKDLVINGMSIPMIAAAEIINGRTYVPVREIGAVFNVTGTWDAASQTATFK